MSSLLARAGRLARGAARLRRLRRARARAEPGLRRAAARGSCRSPTLAVARCGAPAGAALCVAARSAGAGRSRSTAPGRHSPTKAVCSAAGRGAQVCAARSQSAALHGRRDRRPRAAAASLARHARARPGTSGRAAGGRASTRRRGSRGARARRPAARRRRARASASERPPGRARAARAPANAACSVRVTAAGGAAERPARWSAGGRRLYDRRDARRVRAGAAGGGSEPRSWRSPSRGARSGPEPAAMKTPSRGVALGDPRKRSDEGGRPSENRDQRHVTRQSRTAFETHVEERFREGRQAGLGARPAGRRAAGGEEPGDRGRQGRRGDPPPQGRHAAGPRGLRRPRALDRPRARTSWPARSSATATSAAAAATAPQGRRGPPRPLLTGVRNAACRGRRRAHC